MKHASAKDKIPSTPFCSLCQVNNNTVKHASAKVDTTTCDPVCVLSLGMIYGIPMPMPRFSIHLT